MQVQPASDQPTRTSGAPTRRERRRTEPVLTTPPPRRPDRLARASAASLITWGVVLVAFAFLLGIALPGAAHQALGEVIVTLATLVGIVLFVIGLARKSGARRPADQRPRHRR